MGFMDAELYIPRQQLLDAVDRVVGNALQNVTQVGFRVESV